MSASGEKELKLRFISEKYLETGFDRCLGAHGYEQIEQIEQIMDFIGIH